MNKHTTSKLTKKELIIEKFHACTGIQRHILNSWYSADESISLNYGIDVNKAKQIIKEYKMDKYSKLLLKYLLFKRRHCNRKNIISGNNLDNKDSDSFKIKTELVKFFEVVFSKGELTSVQINKATGSASIKNDCLIKAFVKLAEDELKKREYNITPLTINEAKKIYREKTDKKWFDDWMQEWKFFDEEEKPVDVKDFVKGRKYYSAGYYELYDYKSLYDEMYYAYAQDHTKERKINKQLINRLTNELEEQKTEFRNNVGIKEKNRIIVQVAFALANLARIDTFLSKTDLQDIDEINVSNNTGRFMHDIMACFGIIDDKTEIYGKSKTYHYTKNLLKNKKSSPKADMQMYLRKQRLSALKSKLSNI